MSLTTVLCDAYEIIIIYYCYCVSIACHSVTNDFDGFTRIVNRTAQHNVSIEYNYITTRCVAYCWIRTVWQSTLVDYTPNEFREWGAERMESHFASTVVTIR